MRKFILPYKRLSRSSLFLARGLPEFRRIKTEGSNYVGQSDDLIINWGNSNTQLRNDILPTIINPQGAVEVASNKLTAFRRFSEVSVKIPVFTTDKNQARLWPICVSRTILRGQSGQGIVITTEGEEPPDAPLYVKYIKKNLEFRVHVFRENIIDVQRKIRNPELTPRDWRIRSHRNGFIYARQSGEPNENSLETAVKAISALNLDFGAVDIVETGGGHGYVLEVNTAPGLTGQTLTSYINCFSSLTIA